MLKERKKLSQPVLKNPERKCQVCGKDYIAKAYMQKTCSLECRRHLWEHNSKTFRGRSPDAMKKYNQVRKAKNPNVWKEKIRKERLEILEKLGSKCIVCGVTNTNWLHVDYAPTMQGTGYRHPRHRKWVLEHLKDFRILCANHHYELSITGMIEGTDITQTVRKV